ncbi:MAG: insulinase family protein [Bacteroidetes bacterium]|jgi:predicted Zn-dependent peptidase|nr:insulinase family protein [Bacteroidota bacterium]
MTVLQPFTNTMKTPDYTLHTLSSGMRLAHKRVAGTRLVHCGFVIGAGSRNDGENPGLAHCLEHMLFKGTNRRKTVHVLNYLEVVGGEMNAFTTKELTAIYATVQARHYGRATDILCDVTFNSNIPQTELDKEKKVIADEISMYLDTPDENIYDEFQEQVFGAHPLAHNILGSIDSLKNISRKDILQFTEKHYTPENMVFVVVGNISAEKAIYYAERFMPDLSNRNWEAKQNHHFSYKPSSALEKTDFSGAYTIMGIPAYPEKHPKRWPLLLLNNLLGGPGLNSRLNLGIREKYGYTYHVESGYQSYQDAGLFHCYLSCDARYVHKSTALIQKELKKLREVKLGVRQLSSARKQFQGQIVMADENRSSLLVHIGKGILRHGRAETLPEVLQRIEKITASDILEVANEILQENRFSYRTFLPS